MHALLVTITLVLAVSLQNVLAQRTVVGDDRLPPDSIELKRNDPPAISTPWRLPKPSDPLYDADKEAQISKENAEKNKETTRHLVRVFERGVFKGYETLSWGAPAKKMGSAFTPNLDLPADAIELSSTEHPDKSDYFPTRPQRRPWNVPDDHILVRVFQGKKFIGWTYMSKEAVARLHPLKVRVTHFGYPGDPQASNNTRLGLGDHNNILNADSVAVTEDLNSIFPFGAKVYIEGTFLGFRHTTLDQKLHHTIAVYDPNGEWKGDFDSYVELPARRK
jgi:hypothetical protein